MGGCTSGWNGYLQTEQSFRLPSGTKCGTGVALLANPERALFSLASRAWSMASWAFLCGSYKIERPFGFHIQILRRSRNRSRAVEIKLHHYRLLPCFEHSVTAIHPITSFNAGRLYTESCPFLHPHCMVHTWSGTASSADGLADP